MTRNLRDNLLSFHSFIGYYAYFGPRPNMLSSPSRPTHHRLFAPQIDTCQKNGVNSLNFKWVVQTS